MDETINELESKAGRVLQTASSLMFASNSLRHMMAEGRQKKQQKQEYKRRVAMKKWRSDMSNKCFGATPFAFAGNITDLCYFYANEKMPKSLISEIDGELRNSVIDTFENAQSRRLIQTEGENFILTTDGLHFIATKGFLENAISSQRNINITQDHLNSVEKHETTYEFNGTERDLGVFNSSETINLDDVKNDMENLDLANKVEINFNAWKEKCIVTTDDGINFQLTDKGKEFLNSEIFKKGSSEVKAAMEEKVIVSGAVAGKTISVVNAEKLLRSATKILEK